MKQGQCEHGMNWENCLLLQSTGPVSPSHRPSKIPLPGRTLSSLLWLSSTHPISLLFLNQNVPSTLHAHSRMRLQVVAHLGFPSGLSVSGGMEAMTLARRQTGWRPGPLAPELSSPTLPLTSPRCRDIANNRRELRRLGITHVLNASHSRWRGTPEVYQGLGIRYLGVEAHDSPAFDMSIHFQTAADFIHRALSQPGGRRGQLGEEGRGTGMTDVGLGKNPGVQVWRDLNDMTHDRMLRI